jgi:hypothetical protein
MNIAMICLVMGVGVGAFIGIIALFLVAQEFLETFYFED